ncbi:SAM-dependent methyltransferase [Cryptosporangium sp. NPDC051539]|uniref:SAM-dependent methyltransferase n=1 Tax=Cryptosporangium sp. NPDC051539 TaxID=3363962 RepID=UPI0037B8D213
MPDTLRAPRPGTPAEVDSFRPNAARMYDYYLGGTNHLAADREAADALLEAVPAVALAARQNRDFLSRVVQFALREGITQFLDLGSGYASPGGVADAALAGGPGVRVVAVDIEPGVVTQVQTLARTSGWAGQVGALHADICDVAGILGHPVTRRMIDLDRPVAILCLAVLHFVPGPLDRVLGPLRRTVAPGSLLAVSHGAATPTPAGRTRTEGAARPAGPTRPAGPSPASISRLIYDCTLTPLTLRSEHDIRAALGECGLVEPGLVPVARWRMPESAPPPAFAGLVGGVSRL